MHTLFFVEGESLNSTKKVSYLWTKEKGRERGNGPLNLCLFCAKTNGLSCVFNLSSPLVVPCPPFTYCDLSNHLTNRLVRVGYTVQSVNQVLSDPHYNKTNSFLLSLSMITLDEIQLNTIKQFSSTKNDVLFHSF